MSVAVAPSDDPTRFAKTWKANGGRVVGYLCDNVPTELIAAAGFLPVRLGGEGLAATPQVDALVRADRGPGGGSAFVDPILERLLDGAYDFLDLLIVPHNRKAIQAIHAELAAAAERLEGLAPPQTYFLDRSYSNSFMAAEFNERQFDLLKARLEQLAGGPIPDERLSEAVALAETGRGLLRRLNALRSAAAPRISGAAALDIYKSGWTSDRAAHNAVLEALIAEASEAPPLDGLRVFVGGSPIDHSGYYRVIEDLGAVVVGEDHCWGARCADRFVDPADPLAGLRRCFASDPACSTTYPMEASIGPALARLHACRAEAAIFIVMEGDGAQLWQTPEAIKRAEAAGVPCLHLKRQPYKSDDDALRAAIGGFLDGVRARAEAKA